MSSINIEDEQLRQRHREPGERLLSSESAPMLPRPESSEPQASNWSNLGTDKRNVLVLIFLYVLQGIPLGLAGSMPMILQARKADYSTQAFFSFAFWPFSVKLLWAPIVDSVYWSRFGRRKSWLVPVQYLIGLFLIVLSYHITSLIGQVPDKDGEHPDIDVMALTATFVALCFLAATQDIAVDGWALTMLKRENVGWASTCNTVGQTAGFFLGNVVFLALESPEFCNKYLRFAPEPTGLVTISGFMFFWAWVFIVTTSVTAKFIHENSEAIDEEPEGIIDTYKVLWKIIKLPAVRRYCIMLLTAKVAFAATDAIAGLKLIDKGMPKEKLALIGAPMIPIQILLPLIISRYTGGDKPLDVFLKAYPFRIVMGFVIAAVVSLTPYYKIGESEFPVWFYVLIICVYAFHQVTLYSIYVAQMAFTAKISDPSVGGTYMTLLNTITNLGGNWPATVALYMVPYLDIKSTQGDTTTTDVDGFYVETAICSVIGFAWLFIFRNKIDRLQSLGSSSWKVK